MKDEEMAEEYIKKNNLEWELECNRTSPIGEVKQAYIVGLKAGRLQWHKVADGDLPTTVGRRFLVSNRYCSMIGYWNGKTFVSADEDVTEIASPIAWCEIPTFDKE